MTRSVALIVLLAVSGALALTRAAVHSGAGLRSEYIAGAGAAGTGRTGVDSVVSTETIASAWNGAPPEQFRARWTGYLVVPQSGSYTISTTSDDGSSVAIDGARVVDNSGDHGLVTRSGTVTLERGPHTVLVDYTQNGGLYAMTWSWAHDGSSESPVPGWALWTKRTSPWRALALRILDPLLLAALIVTVLFGAVHLWQAKGRDATGSVVGWWGARRNESDEPAVASDPQRSRAWLRWVLPVGSLIVALLIAEGFARLLFRSVRSSGDARTFFATRNEPQRVNKLGFRDADIGEKTGRYRIIVIGDSLTWGVGLPEADRYTSLLQRFLGGEYEVLNFGIPGHNMPEHLQELDLALPLAPDFILLQLYTNDFEIASMERPRARPLLPWRAADRWMLQSSALYTMVAAQWPRIQEKVGLVETYEHYMFRHLGDPQSPESREGFGMLHTFIARARKAGVPMGAVMFPNPEVMEGHYPFDYLHERVQEVCMEEDIRCVDLRAPFLSSFSSVKDIVVSPFDGHPSARASLVAADQILAEFRQGWRPCALRIGDGGCQVAATAARPAEPQSQAKEAPAPEKPKASAPHRPPRRRRSN